MAILIMDNKEIRIRILSPEEIVLDQGQNLRIFDGIPTFKDVEGKWSPVGTEMIVVPNSPHVFTVDRLTVTDRNHYKSMIGHVKIILAHAVRIDNIWKFQEGGNVVDTVKAYNKYASEHGLGPIEFVIACNESDRSPLNIRVGEFDADQNIAYAVGENVQLTGGGYSRVATDDKVYIDISVDKDFFGLDQLIKHKEIGSRIKILDPVTGSG